MKISEEHLEQPSPNSNNEFNFIHSHQQPQQEQSTEDVTYLELVRKNILQITSISPGKISTFNSNLSLWLYPIWLNFSRNTIDKICEVERKCIRNAIDFKDIRQSNNKYILNVKIY